MAWKFRTRLAELRKERGVERMDFVRKAGMAYTTVLNWENDLLHSIDANKLKQVMDLLECSNLDEMIEFVQVEE
jgi:transcriptional regulator with XRE-family HTH domain